MAGACPIIAGVESQWDENGFPLCVFGPSGCCAENDWHYRPGGLPPVDIGDKFHEGQFTILYKLGYGFSSTVWLAVEENTKSHVALKMMCAHDSESCMQAKVQEFLCQDGKPPLDPRILKIRDSFVFESPNGQHTCLVFEWVGPSLHDVLCGHKIRPDSARKLAKDITTALQYLHINDVVFGDLSTSNILVRLKKWSQEEAAAFVECLGRKLYTCPLETYRGREAWAHHGPKNQYGRIESRDFRFDVLIPEITLTDLNEAVILNGQVENAAEQEPSAVRMSIAAPEYIFGINQRHTKASDICSLACCFFEMRASKALITSEAAPEIGRDMVELLGHPPQSWIDSIKSSPEHSGHEVLSAINDGEEQENRTLEARIRAIGNWSPLATMTWQQRRQYYIEKYDMDFANDPVSGYVLEDGRPPPAKLSTEEFGDFYDLLSRMLCYSPDKRITIDEVLAHPWLNRSYDDLDAPAAWLSVYDEFRDVCSGMSQEAQQASKEWDKEMSRRFPELENLCWESMNTTDQPHESADVIVLHEELPVLTDGSEVSSKSVNVRPLALTPSSKDLERDFESDAESEESCNTVDSVFSVKNKEMIDSGHLDGVLTHPRVSGLGSRADETCQKQGDESKKAILYGQH